MDFEKKLTRLEEIVGKMEGGDVSLEDSLKLFEEGVKLSRTCQKELEEAEQKVELLLGQDYSSISSPNTYLYFPGAAPVCSPPPTIPTTCNGNCKVISDVTGNSSRSIIRNISIHVS